MTKVVKNKQKWWSKKSSRILAKKTIVYVLCILGGSILMIPLIWQISTSLKEPSQIFTYPIRWIPKPVVWRNYVEVFQVAPMLLWIRNSFFVTFISLFGDIISCSLVAYSFARLRFPGKRVLFLLLLSTLMIPYPVTIIPSFLIFKYLGWIDTYIPLILPAYLAYPMWVFLLRQFFMGIPLELSDAATIDGCTTFGIYWRIILPLAKPALGVIAIFSFMGYWRDFFRPLIYLNSATKLTLAIGLRSFQGLYSTRWELVMVASMISVAPCILLFFLTQKHFIQGIVLTGVKG